MKQHYQNDIELMAVESLPEFTAPAAVLWAAIPIHPQPSAEAIAL